MLYWLLSTSVREKGPLGCHCEPLSFCQVGVLATWHIRSKNDGFGLPSFVFNVTFLERMCMDYPPRDTIHLHRNNLLQPLERPSHDPATMRVIQVMRRVIHTDVPSSQYTVWHRSQPHSHVASPAGCLTVILTRLKRLVMAIIRMMAASPFSS